MTFLKVVEGSQIYNFPIHCLEHFYSIFWSKLILNRGTLQSRVRPCTTVRASASGPRASEGRSFPMPRAFQGPLEVLPLPSHRVPMLEPRAAVP
jgi:hypothetical protein